jgi:PilZ domain
LTWAITLATFVLTAVVVILIFLLYSKRSRLREVLGKTPQRRLEVRTSARADVELYRLEEPTVREIAFTKNISHHGVCAVTKNRWVPNNAVQVRFWREDIRARARIVYCKPLYGAFIMGLHFSRPIHFSTKLAGF